MQLKDRWTNPGMNASEIKETDSPEVYSILTLQLSVIFPSRLALLLKVQDCRNDYPHIFLAVHRTRKYLENLVFLFRNVTLSIRSLYIFWFDALNLYICVTVSSWKNEPQKATTGVSKVEWEQTGKKLFSQLTYK